MRILKLTLVMILATMLSEVTFAQDWANLARYQDENTKLGLPMTAMPKA